MSINVKFFATLRESLGIAQIDVAASADQNVADVWHLATGGEAMPDHVLCAVNLEHVSNDTRINDGDEVAYFPPVTGG